jgi:hypothetical protein
MANNLDEKAAAFLSWGAKMRDGKAIMICPWKQTRLPALQASFLTGYYHCSDCQKYGHTDELFDRLIEIKRVKDSGWLDKAAYDQVVLGPDEFPPEAA